jgi:hypothetical protein
MQYRLPRRRPKDHKDDAIAVAKAVAAKLH